MKVLKLFAIAVGVCAVGLGGFVAFVLTSKGTQAVAASNLDDITRKVAADAVAQYGIAKRNGSPTDACVAAMGVAAAYLQAKDEAAYAQWKQTQAKDCAAAGMPTP